MTRVLVTGATGNVGRHVVAGLGARGVPVRAFSRDAGRAAQILGPGTDIATGDFADPHSLRRALDGADRMFLCCPNDVRQVEYGTHAVEAAAAAGVGHLVMLSTVGAEPGAESVFADQHGRIEQHVRTEEIDHVILRSGFLMSNILGSLRAVRETGRFFLPGGSARVAAVDPRDVGACAAALLAGPGRGIRSYVVTGPEALTFEAFARELSAGTGRTIEFTDVTDDDAVEGLVRAGRSRWLAEGIVGMFEALREGVNSRTTDTVQQLTGQEPRSAVDFARDILKPLLTS
ncbi:NmrA family NAD(P)-binding protein [Streptomyces meridianus]|uniref:NAD(P)H-binding protein n=1 Tax=Streptomyces meridianus TaxID=2938945 RepID=A0ABT0X8X0_9ACTN|nr:NAD(P)H-binding protein [Streptomyces meridianus]MCM2578978.1 NAD(P)H-binding protein [Streptomyces meridianus]